ncbi:MAG: hypothetical protein WCD86_01790 [Ktedonobacteraceae bacterium]
MLRRYAIIEHLTTLLLLLAIVLGGVKIVQMDLPKPAPPRIAFTCAVAVHALTGELCVEGPSGASVRITVHYCDGTQVSSQHLQDQGGGEYRWIWHVQTSCWGRGTAWAKAIATWPGNVQAEAIATFDIA